MKVHFTPIDKDTKGECNGKADYYFKQNGDHMDHIVSGEKWFGTHNQDRQEETVCYCNHQDYINDMWKEYESLNTEINKENGAVKCEVALQTKWCNKQ